MDYTTAQCNTHDLIMDFTWDEMWPYPSTSIAGSLLEYTSRKHKEAKTISAQRFNRYLLLSPASQECLDRLLLDGWTGDWDSLVACAVALGDGA